MKAFVVGALLVAAAAMVLASREFGLETYDFHTYMKEHGKKYAIGSEEYHMRKNIFTQKVKEVIAHNNQPKRSFNKGVNHLTDRTVEELKFMNGYKGHQLRQVIDHLDATVAKKHELSSKAAPATVDYRMRPGVLSGIKDQGMCGSCWAHGTTETIESHAAINFGKLFTLSQQQLTACAPNPNQCGGTGGCGGSTAELAMAYLTESQGQAQEWTYPYTAYFGTTGTCNFGPTTPGVVALDYYTKLPKNDKTAIMDALANKGPLIINVDASQWQSYSSGIFDGCNYANNITIDHVVQLVGYGTDASVNQDYWIVRNSWSPTWGENGYIRLLRQNTEQCGNNVNPTQGDGCPGGAATQYTCGQCGILFDVSYPNIIRA